MRREETRRSVAVLIPRFGLFAAIRSRKNGDNYELPGGKVEPGESDVEAARRETYEEVGPILAYATPLLSLGTFEHQHHGETWSCEVFVGQHSGAHPRGSVEGAATWATREELLAGTYGEVVRRIFTAYDAQIAEALDGC